MYNCKIIGFLPDAEQKCPAKTNFKDIKMKFGKSFVLLLLVLFTCCIVPEVSAVEGKTPSDRIKVVLGPMRKLGRGFANVLLCPLELPMTWKAVNNELGGVAGITYGTLKGICCVFARFGVGIIDIATFPFPLPNCPDDPEGFGSGYGPILTPEWVIGVDDDWQNFVYNNEAIVVDQN